jgi:hypothetical protein
MNELKLLFLHLKFLVSWPVINVVLTWLGIGHCGKNKKYKFET